MDPDDENTTVRVPLTHLHESEALECDLFKLLQKMKKCIDRQQHEHMQLQRELFESQRQNARLQQELLQKTIEREQLLCQCDRLEQRLKEQSAIAQEKERELDEAKAALEETRHERDEALRQLERNRTAFRCVVQDHCAVVPLAVTYAEAFAGTTKQVAVRGGAVAVTVPPGARSHDVLVADAATTTTRGLVFVVLLARCAQFKRVGNTLYALRRANGTFPHPDGRDYARHATARGFVGGACVALDADAFSAVASEDDDVAAVPPSVRPDEVLAALRAAALQRLRPAPGDAPGDPMDALLALYRPSPRRGAESNTDLHY